MSHGGLAMHLLAQLDPLQGFALLAAASALAGAVNSVAGGGTILTFPVLGAILPDLPGRLVTANATSTIGLWPGAATAAWAYRGERSDLPGWARWLIVPSVLGAVAGTMQVVALPRLTSHASSATAAASPGRIAAACGMQLLVGIYGGYFGAGIGILMLAVLSLLGLGDIHRLNGVKNVLGTVVNGVAAGMFAIGSFAGAHAVSWPHAAVMAAASILGGFGASHLARRLPARLVRRCVALIGFGLAAYYFLR